MSCWLQANWSEQGVCVACAHKHMNAVVQCKPGVRAGLLSVCVCVCVCVCVQAIQSSCPLICTPPPTCL